MKRISVLESAHAMRNRNILCGMTMIILFMVISGCAGPWKGKIIDVETKEPLEGAVVLAVWQRVYRTPTGSSTYFYEAKETVTNRAGEFEIPSYTPINMLPIISYMSEPEFTIFKPGYGSLRSLSLGGYFTGERKDSQDFEIHGNKYIFAIGKIELPMLKSREERLGNIPGGPTDIGSDRLPLFYRSINDERRNLGLKGEVR